MTALLAIPRWLTNEGDVTLATWGLVAATLVLAIVTLLLVIDSSKLGREQRKRWQREDEQARIRKKQDYTNSIIEKFNAPAMLVARAETAYQLLGEPSQSITGTERAPKSPRLRLAHEIPYEARDIANFFERLAREWQGNLLNTDAVDFALGDYLLVFAGEFDDMLTAKHNSTKYESLNKLVEVLRSKREHPSEVPGVDSFSAGWSQARQQFWYSEYKLFRLFPSELPPLPRSNA